MNSAVLTRSKLFDVELEGETVIVTPLENLGELAFQEIDAGAKEVLDFLNRTKARNVVVDMQWMDYCGSTALGFFLRLLKRVGGRNGRMAFCNVSEHDKEIFRVVHLGGLWPIYFSREEALQAVNG